jgi:hypothetical protein
MHPPRPAPGKTQDERSIKFKIATVEKACSVEGQGGIIKPKSSSRELLRAILGLRRSILMGCKNIG